MLYVVQKHEMDSADDVVHPSFPAVWRPDGTPPHGAALGMMGGFLGMAAMAAGGMPFPPDFGFDGFDFPMPMAPPIPPPVF